MKQFYESLEGLEDLVFNEKQAWQNYLLALIEAFEETNVHLLIDRWANVDKLWMQIRGPIQPGHPLEYYEDHTFDRRLLWSGTFVWLIPSIVLRGCVSVKSSICQ